MAQPRISVLLPAHQAESTLDTCLKSLRRQRETRWECVLVDDGSRDGTAAVARTHAHRDPRVRVLSLPHRGLVHALSAGLERCRAPFVARMDADDWMHRDRLGAQLRALEEDAALAGVGCHVRLFPRRPFALGQGLGDGLRAYESWLNGITSAADVRAEAFVECPLAHPGMMFRREALSRFGYRDCEWPEDYDLVLRMLGAGLSLGVVPRRLLAWRDSPSRLSRRHPRYGLDRFTACKAAHLADTFLADAVQYLLWGYGHTGRALRRALARHDRHPSHVIELHPGRLGQRIHGAPVVAPDEIPSLPRRPLVASVAGAEARGQIRRALVALGWRETIDFVCAA
ncbi:MAG: glycosyltransferase family 2 protein [Proteobacteria bacterium]|nr:glycosyltransferase family 2 protein [Pseudomonadota bacterium]